MPAFSTRYSTLPDLASLTARLDLEGDRADLRVRHQAAGTEQLADLADRAHHVRSGDGRVKVVPARLDLGHQVVGADMVGTGRLGLLRLLALGEDQDAHGLAEPVGEDHGAAHHLVGLAGVDAETHTDIDRLVELGVSVSLTRDRASSIV